MVIHRRQRSGELRQFAYDSVSGSPACGAPCALLQRCCTIQQHCRQYLHVPHCADCLLSWVKQRHELQRHSYCVLRMP
jgi:hypothetical protein